MASTSNKKHMLAIDNGKLYYILKENFNSKSFGNFLCTFWDHRMLDLVILQLLYVFHASFHCFKICVGIKELLKPLQRSGRNADFSWFWKQRKNFLLLICCYKLAHHCVCNCSGTLWMYVKFVDIFTVRLQDRVSLHWIKLKSRPVGFLLIVYFSLVSGNCC